jgi:hypothetical protein
MARASLVIGGKMETVLTPATHRLLLRFIRAGRFGLEELDCFLAGPLCGRHAGLRCILGRE